MFKSCFTSYANSRKYYRHAYPVPCRTVTVWEKAVVTPSDMEAAIEGLRGNSLMFKENEKRGKCHHYLGWDKVTFSKTNGKIYLSRRVSLLEHCIIV